MIVEINAYFGRNRRKEARIFNHLSEYEVNSKPSAWIPQRSVEEALRIKEFYYRQFKNSLSNIIVPFM